MPSSSREPGVSQPETSTLWDALARVRAFTGHSHRLPLRLLVAIGITLGVTFVGSLLTLSSGDYGPKGTEATGVVWGLGAIVVMVLLVVIVANGARALVILVGGLGVVKELVARGEAGAPDSARARDLHAARTQLLESVPAAAFWVVSGLAALGMVAVFAWTTT